MYATAGALGFAFAGVSLAAKVQAARLKPLRLRQADGKTRRISGLARRLEKLRLVDIDDAFKLANRRTEIEVTL